MKTKSLIACFFMMYFAFLAKSQITHSVSFTAPDLSITNLKGGDSVTYCSIKITNLSVNGDPGSPALPVKYIKLIIPTNKDAGNIVINQTSKVDYTLNHYIYPQQPPQPISISSLPPVFTPPNPAIYNSTNPWPSTMVKVVDQGFFDGKNRIITIAICPFQYYPTINKLEYYTNINFTLSFVNSTSQGLQVLKRLASDQTDYDNLLRGFVDNPEDIPLYQIRALNIVDNITDVDDVKFYKYVIITNDCYRDNFNEFVQWKRRKGIDVGVVTLEDINTWGYTADALFPGHNIVDVAGRVRTYLRDGFVNGTVYALLAWNINAQPLPIRYGYPNGPTNNWDYIVPNDIYFSDFNSDWKLDGDDYYGEPEDLIDFNPEIFVGRLLVNNEQDIANWTTKIKIYEQNPGNGDYSYLTKYFRTQADGLEISSSSLSNLSMFQHTEIKEFPSYYSLYDINGMVVGSDPPIYGNTKGAQIIENMNNSHYGLISWYNHGGTGEGASGCGTMTSGDHNAPYWKIDAEDAYKYHDEEPEANNGFDNLTNFNYPAIVYTISCDLMPYDLTKSYGNIVPNTTPAILGRNCGESFTVNNLAGGVAFLGNTRFGFYDPSESLFAAFTYFIKNAENNPYFNTFGHLGMTEGISKFYSGSYYIKYSHNLVGCPETQMWTATPTIFDASVTPSEILLNNSHDVTVNINNLTYNKQATICLYNGAEIFSVFTVSGDINNHATHTFPGITPLCLNNIQVTITSYNYIPYMTDILVSDCIYSSTPLNITQNTTWSESRIINQNVHVKSGATLTIPKNIRIAFNSQAKMIVEAGGKLIVDGGDLTNGCSEGLWYGIEVLGNPNQMQNNPLYQGYVELKNNATIENALIGIHCVTNAYIPAKSTQTYYSSGGIINANGAIFKNNHVSVNIEPFTSPYTTGSYYSPIANCKFEYPKVVDYNTDFDIKYIKINGIKNINIYSNHFEGNTSNNFQLRGTGMEVIDATFKLYNQDTENPIPNYFNNMTYGIRCSNTSGLANPDISLASFTNCWRAIYLSGVSTAKVLKNFIIFKSQSSNAGEESYGIYLDNCDA